MAWHRVGDSVLNDEEFAEYGILLIQLIVAALVVLGLAGVGYRLGGPAFTWVGGAVGMLGALIGLRRFRLWCLRIVGALLLLGLILAAAGLVLGLFSHAPL
jgi:hypothetical protein